MSSVLRTTGPLGWNGALAVADVNHHPHALGVVRDADFYTTRDEIGIPDRASG